MRQTGNVIRTLSLLAAAVGAFVLVASGQLILGLCAAAVASLFIGGWGRR